MLDRITIKRTAKSLMRETKPSVYMVTLVYVVIGCVLSVLANRLAGVDDFVRRIVDDIRVGIIPEYGTMSAYYSAPTFFEGLLILLIDLVNYIIAAGFTFYCLHVFRGREADVRTLFDGFEHFGKVLGIVILSAIVVALWSILLVIPGIIAAYRYSFSLYVLLENPELSVIECMRESKRLTRGYKMSLFIVDLSFIGWHFVGSLIASLVGMIVGANIPIFDIWLMPYIGIVSAGCYAYVCRDKNGVPLREIKDAGENSTEM